MKAVIFDMDGTMIDNWYYHEQSWIKFLNGYNISVTPEKVRENNFGSLNETLRRYFGNTRSKQEITKLGEEKESIYRNLYSNYIVEVDGLTSFLKLLKEKKFKIGLATHGNEENVNMVLDSLKISTYFEVITYGSEIKKGKPDPEIYLITITKLHIQSCQAYALEDSLSGIKAAKDAGLKVIAISTSYSTTELERSDPVKIIRDYTDLIKEFDSVFG